MTTDNQPIAPAIPTTPVAIEESQQQPFGKRLQSAREAMNLECKDIAAHLRLNEKIIWMLETNQYADTIPTTFLRGYFRSYAKFLSIPEDETLNAIEHIKAKPVAATSASAPNTQPIMLGQKNSNRMMHLLTAFILFAMVGLIATWWYSYNNKPSSHPRLASNQIAPLPVPVETREQPQIAPVTEASNIQETPPTPPEVTPTPILTENAPLAVASATPAAKPAPVTPASRNDDDYDDLDTND